MTRIIIGRTRDEKEADKKLQKTIDLLSAEDNASRRNEDLFIGGPMDGEVCEHQPNGPRADDDKEHGYWADYYFLDKMNVEQDGSKSRVVGYHLYSSARGFHESWDQEGNKFVTRKGHEQHADLGLRGPGMRKCYYYVGFIDDKILAMDGIILADFYEIHQAN